MLCAILAAIGLSLGCGSAPAQDTLSGQLIPGPRLHQPRPLLPVPAPIGGPIGENLIGLRVHEAEQRAAAHGFELRAISIDGEGQYLTRDYRRNRLNVVIRDGRVTRVDGAY